MVQKGLTVYCSLSTPDARMINLPFCAFVTTSDTDQAENVNSHAKHLSHKRKSLLADCRRWLEELDLSEFEKEYNQILLPTSVAHMSSAEVTTAFFPIVAVCTCSWPGRAYNILL